MLRLRHIALLGPLLRPCPDHAKGRKVGVQPAGVLHLLTFGSVLYRVICHRCALLLVLVRQPQRAVLVDMRSDYFSYLCTALCAKCAVENLVTSVFLRQAVEPRVRDDLSTSDPQRFPGQTGSYTTERATDPFSLPIAVHGPQDIHHGTCEPCATGWHQGSLVLRRAVRTVSSRATLTSVGLTWCYACCQVRAQVGGDSAATGMGP